jgi:hypothetical protein
MTTSIPGRPERVLIVGRSPRVLETAVDLLREAGYAADATNQFGSVLDDYDVRDLDMLVFGGMVPRDTKQSLREEISVRNPGVTFVQGLAGIAGVIAAQVQSASTPQGIDGAAISYDPTQRVVQMELTLAAHVTIRAWWATSFAPPEPTDSTMTVFDEDLPAGRHEIALPDVVPAQASFATVSAAGHTEVFTVGPMPQSVMRMVPTGSGDVRLPAVRPLATHHDED